MRRTTLETLDHTELEPYRTLREHTLHWKEGHFVAEGEKTVRALLASQLEVRSLLMDERWLSQLQTDLENLRFAETNVFVASDAMMQSIVGHSLHQNLLAIGSIPPNPTLQSLHTDAPGRHVHVALEGLADAENVGMILRNCAAFGVSSLLVGSDSSSPWLRRSVRVSLGNVFSLRIHQTPNLQATLRTCQEELEWHLIGTTPRGGLSSIKPYEGGMARHICLLFGSEAHGLSQEAQDLCDELFSIPMHGGVDSLNVANASAAILHEATRGMAK